MFLKCPSAIAKDWLAKIGDAIEGKCLPPSKPTSAEQAAAGPRSGELVLIEEVEVEVCARLPRLPPPAPAASCLPPQRAELSRQGCCLGCRSLLESSGLPLCHKLPLPSPHSHPLRLLE